MIQFLLLYFIISNEKNEQNNFFWISDKKKTTIGDIFSFMDGLQLNKKSTTTKKKEMNKIIHIYNLYEVRCSDGAPFHIEKHSQSITANYRIFRFFFSLPNVAFFVPFFFFKFFSILNNHKTHHAETICT